MKIKVVASGEQQVIKVAGIIAVGVEVDASDRGKKILTLQYCYLRVPSSNGQCFYASYFFTPIAWLVVIYWRILKDGTRRSYLYLMDLSRLINSFLYRISYS